MSTGGFAGGRNADPYCQRLLFNCTAVFCFKSGPATSHGFHVLANNNLMTSVLGRLLGALSPRLTRGPVCQWVDFLDNVFLLWMCRRLTLFGAISYP